MENSEIDTVYSRQPPLEPSPDPIIPTKDEPWYKHPLHGVTKNPNVTFFIGVGVFLLIGLTVAMASFRGSQDVRTKATTHTAKVSILPSTISIPTNGTLQIWATTDSPLSFANIEITYDITAIKLVQEVILTTSTWGRTIKSTTMADANYSGKLVMVIGLDPLYIQSPPNGTFQIATLKFDANTTSNNVSTTVAVSASSSQLVATDTTVFTLTTEGSTITVNPLATPTSTVTITPMATVTPPSLTITPSTPNDTTPPTVTITTPAEASTIPSKGNMAIRTTASDANGISKITITFDGVIIKTCSGAVSCQVNQSVNKLSSGSHTITATAIDNSANKNTTSSSIAITK